MRPPTDEELETLPHVLLTSEEDWDPRVLNHNHSDDPDWHDAIPDAPPLFPLFDDVGNLCTPILAN